MVDRRRLAHRFLVITALLLCGCQQNGAIRDERLRVTIDQQVFHLEIAADADTRYQGLSDRESIPADGGMVFVFPDAQVRQFVMRRCLTPIDIVFLGPGGRVTAMHAMAVEPSGTPEDRLKRYSSGWPSQFAIELAGGTLHKMSLEHGDLIELPLAALKAKAR